MEKSEKEDKLKKTKVKNKIIINPSLNEAPLSVAQRAKKAIQFRKIRSRVARGKKRAEKRMASNDKLGIRAQRKALLVLKKKVAGQRGADYANLTRSQKVAVDRAVEKRKKGGIVKRLARKLFPGVRKAERERLKSVLSRGSKTESFEIQLEKFLNEEVRQDRAYKRYHTLYDKNGKVKYDQRFKFNKKVTQDNLKENVDSIMTLLEDEDVSLVDLKELEKFANRILERFGIDVEFTKHFKDRMNDERNNPKISVDEMREFFKKVEKNKAKKLKTAGEHSVVLKDIQTDLNIPVALEWDKDGRLDVVAKTVMRKKKFSDFKAPFIKY